jgi:hypothetical protein
VILPILISSGPSPLGLHLAARGRREDIADLKKLIVDAAPNMILDEGLDAVVEYIQQLRGLYR